MTCNLTITVLEYQTEKHKGSVFFQMKHRF